jgi:hypothetical protein
MRAMADGQPNQPNQGWQSAPRPIGSGEGEVPLAAPTQNVTARTMASDLASMQSAGGGQPRPYVPPPAPQHAPQPMPVRPQGNPAPQAPMPPRPTPPPQQPAAPVVRPSIPSQPPKPPVPVGSSPKRTKKGGLVALVVVLVVVALGALGYFVVYPLMNQPTIEEPAAETQTPPTAPPVSEVPPVEEPQTPPVSASAQHVSLFTVPADVTSDALIAEPSLAAVTNAFTFDTAEVPVLEEVVLKDTAGNLISAATIANLIDPTTFPSAVADQFEPDATVFSFTDANGTWIGFALKAKDVTALPMLVASVQNIESEHSLSGYFLSNPGTQTTWKDGQASGYATRYLSFSQPGAALNYGWVGMKLVVSASYGGFKEAINRLR